MRLRESGRIADSCGETWKGVSIALRRGTRGLRAPTALATLLAQHRGVRRHARRPPLTVERILPWADAHHARTGEWPGTNSGRIEHSSAETWLGVNNALKHGLRGFPGGSSLAQLLVHHPHVHYHLHLPPLSIVDILEWADRFHARTGSWPTQKSGEIDGTSRETWMAVDMSLRHGHRGLAGGSSLAGLLAEERGVRNRKRLPKLTVDLIVSWADAHHKRTGTWPNAESGPIPDSGGETWKAVQMALVRGGRGLAGGLSISRVLDIRGRTRSTRSRAQVAKKRMSDAVRA